MKKNSYIFLRRVLRITKEILIIVGMIIAIILQLKQVLSICFQLSFLKLSIRFL